MKNKVKNSIALVWNLMDNIGLFSYFWFFSMSGVFFGFVMGNFLPFILLPLNLWRESFATTSLYLGYILGCFIALKMYVNLIKKNELYDFDTDLFSFIRLRKLPIGTIMLLFVLGLSVRPTVAGTSIIGSIGVFTSTEMTFMTVLLIIVCSIVIEPIIRELIFRTIILRKLKSKYNIKLAIVVQGLLYGIFNLSPLYFFYGIIICFAVLWTGSLLSGIIISAAQSYSLLIRAMLDVGFGDYQLYKFGGNYALVLKTVVFIVVIFLLYKNRNNDAFDEKSTYFTEKW